MRPVLAVFFLSGCLGAQDAPADGWLLHFDLANESVPEGETVRIGLRAPTATVGQEQHVPYDPIAPSASLDVAWDATFDVEVVVDAVRSNLSARGEFDLGGQDEWWFYVAVYGDRVRLERFADRPAYG